MKRGPAGVAMVAAAAAGWGTWSLFLYRAGLPAQLSNVIVFAVMGVAALPLALRERVTPTVPVAIALDADRRRARVRFEGWDRTAVLLLFANAICDVLNSLCFFEAIGHTSVAIAVITHYAAPILIALAAPYIDRVETRGARPAAVIALTGLVLVLEPWHSNVDGALIGAAFGLTSAVFYAANVFVVRRLATRIGTLRAISYHSLIGAVLTLPWALPYVSRVTGPAFGWLAAGAILLGVGSNTLFIGGLQRIGSGRTAVLTFAEPLVAVAIGILVWHQPFGPIAVVGGALVLAAGIHVARQAR
ncbi:MAG: DMT family transporter [Kofleriaceae bacterium]